MEASSGNTAISPSHVFFKLATKYPPINEKPHTKSSAEQCSILILRRGRSPRLRMAAMGLRGRVQHSRSKIRFQKVRSPHVTRMLYCLHATMISTTVFLMELH